VPLLALCLLAALWTWLSRPRHVSIGRPVSEAPPHAESDSSDVRILDWTRRAAGDARANPDRPGPVTLPVVPQPVVPAAPVVPEVASAPVAPPSDGPGAGGSPPEGPAAGASTPTSEPEAGIALAEEVALRPRWIKHPSVPEKILRKRKIDGAVRLQTRVGADGRVIEVRVLQEIPNCAECTESAVAAARQYVYDPPVLAEGASGVWTPAMELHFGYRR
jgi:outer membrane biosynthesis protein TonB